jgi:hypothetical protein
VWYRRARPLFRILLCSLAVFLAFSASEARGEGRVDRHAKKDGRDVDRTGNHSSCPSKTGTDALGVSGEPVRLQETEHAISHHSHL